MDGQLKHEQFPVV